MKHDDIEKHSDVISCLTYLYRGLLEPPKRTVCNALYRNRETFSVSPPGWRCPKTLRDPWRHTMSFYFTKIKNLKSTTMNSDTQKFGCFENTQSILKSSHGLKLFATSRFWSSILRMRFQYFYLCSLTIILRRYIMLATYRSLCYTNGKLFTFKYYVWIIVYQGWLDYKHNSAL